MNSELFEKNMQSIGKFVDTWESFLREKCNNAENDDKDNNIEIRTEKSQSGETIFTVIESTGTKLYLSGKYNPRKYVKDWVDEKQIRDNSLVIVIGFGDGIFVKEILNIAGKNSGILVYEPSLRIFIKALQEVELSEVFDSRRVALVVKGMNDDEWDSLVNSELDLEQLAETYVYINPNYSRIFTEDVSKAWKIIKERFQLVRSNWNTMMRYTGESGINMIRNLKYLLSGYTINRLYAVLPETFPCVIVAAGPSLNKNIDDLKKIKKRACIIACDTAMKPLLSHGIDPDFFLVVDAKKPKMLLDYPGVERVPFVTTLSVPHDIMDFHIGKKFFYYCGEEIFRKVVDSGFRDRNKPVPIDEGVSYLSTGGSVATSAFSLAKYMGSKTIILVGQDLAFTNNKSHADGTFDDKMEEVNNISYFPQVEDIYGNMVYTPPDMKCYLEWYEKEISADNECKVIDATEGGALIKGTEIMTLSDAVDKYCNQEIDIQEHLEHLPELFEESEKKYVIDYLNSLPEQASKVMVEVQNLKKDYKKLGKLADKDNKVSEVVKLSRKIAKKVKRLEENEIYLLMVGFMKGYEYTLRASLNQKEENEILSFAKQGELYLSIMEKIMKLVIPEIEKGLCFDMAEPDS